METLQKLQSRVTTMLKLYSALRSDKTQLEKQVAKQTEQMEQQRAEIERLREELKALTLHQAAKGLDDEQKVYFTKQIDQVIAELDKNLDLLK